MSYAERILVTGPTGTVGGPLLAHVTERGLPVVAGAREPAVVPADVECVALDFTRPETFDAALTGVDRVFLMRPPAISDAVRHIRPFIAAASRHGVRHVVFLSVMGVNRALPHWRVEQDLVATTMGWTFLRPSFFAQNLETAYRADIRDHDAIRVPAGRGRTSFVDTRDVAAVAALVLGDPAPHAGRAYTLTGPAALDYHQVASMLSAELGRAIGYAPPTLLGYRRELLRQGYPADYATVQLVINVVARLGLAARVTDTTERLLGRPATALATYLHDRRDRWTAD
jgi:uncharacterized protein YbjT (DUF2867 family)